MDKKAKREYKFAVAAMNMVGNVFAPNKKQAVRNVQELIEEYYHEWIPAADIRVQVMG